MKNRILPSVEIPSMANAKNITGMDNVKYAMDRKHFENYPYDVDYMYNSRGFRDVEWPDDENLPTAIWCFGDSFTLGTGSPFNHTWPQVLSARLETRTINISMNGASNDWIARKCCEVYTGVQPEKIAIMWSYLHRREHYNSSFDDRQRRLAYPKTTIEEDIQNLIDCIDLVVDHCKNSKIAMAIVPRWEMEFSETIITQDDWDNMKDIAWPVDVPKTIEDFKSLDSHIQHELVELHGIDLEKLYKQLDADGEISANKHIQRIRQSIIQVKKLDLARDGHHFDIKTSIDVVDKMHLHLL